MWGNSRVIGIPVFMDAKNLQAFIDEGLRHGSKKSPRMAGLVIDNEQSRQNKTEENCIITEFFGKRRKNITS